MNPEGDAELGICGDAAPGDIDLGAGGCFGVEVDYACEEHEFIELGREQIDGVLDFGGPVLLPDVGLLG
ncbi:MAG: hypothetical protein RI897_3398 [Verrucomicrobiota bacterium]